MTNIFQTTQLGTIRIGRRIGMGGEGAVFEVEGRDDLAAKVYHEPPSKEKSEKLLALIRFGTKRLKAVSAWPVDVISSRPGGPVAGFLMERIEWAEELHALHSPRSRLQKFPDASWSFMLFTAADLARVAAEIHDHGLIIGDFNPKNILVTKRASVMFLDCDGFQLSMSDHLYRCEAGFPECIPPELQGKSMREIDLRPEHDRFGLAVLIFQLLFLGRHPFSGRFLGEGEMSLERAIREYRFAYGADAESRGMTPPLGAPALKAAPATLDGLFRRAFLSTNPADRPRPDEWTGPLDSLSKSLKCCSLHTGHQFYNESPACPWCEIESRALVRLFNFPSDRRDQKRAHFKLQEVWNAIESVSPPPPESPREDDPPKKSKSLKGVFNPGLQRIVGEIIPIFFAGIIGFTIPWATPIYLSIPLIFLAAFLMIKLIEIKSKQGWISRLTRRTIEAAQDLEMKWRNEASEQRFIQKLKDLQSQKQTYERLSQIRTARLKKIMADGRADQFNHFLARGLIESTAQSFVFNPGDDALSRARIEVEREIDRLRVRIEDELAGGASSLNRLKQQIEESRRNLRPALMRACRALGQARQDSKASWNVDKRYLKSRAVILLFASFLTAALLEKIDQDIKKRRERGCFHRGCSKPDVRSTARRKSVSSAPLPGTRISMGKESVNTESALVKNGIYLKADVMSAFLLKQGQEEFYKSQYQILGLDQILKNYSFKNTKFLSQTIAGQKSRRRMIKSKAVFVVSARPTDHSCTDK